MIDLKINLSGCYKNFCKRWQIIIQSEITHLDENASMGTFAETPIVYYRLSFTNQGKETSVFRMYTCPYIFIYLYVNINLYTVYLCVCIYIHFYIYILPFQTENWSPGDFPYSVYHLLIVQMEVWRWFVCWWRNKQKLSVCKRTKRTWPSMGIYIKGKLRKSGLPIVSHNRQLEIGGNRKSEVCSTLSVLVIDNQSLTVAGSTNLPIYAEMAAWPVCVEERDYLFAVLSLKSRKEPSGDRFTELTFSIYPFSILSFRGGGDSGLYIPSYLLPFPVPLPPLNLVHSTFF